jgi:hypothetical protein
VAARAGGAAAPGAKYRSAGFFVLRTPLLPLSVVRRLSEVASPGPDGGPHPGEAALARVQARLRDELRVLAGRREVEEAIYVASPALHDAVLRWRDSPDAPPNRKIEPALAKYILRMSTRSTPFGLFAGTAPGQVDTRTDLRVSEPASWKRFARIDSALVEKLVDGLARSRDAGWEVRR